MGNKLFPTISILLLTMLACSIPGAISPSEVTDTVPASSFPGVTPGGTDVTPDVVLPPPPRLPVLEVAYVKGGNIWLWTEASGPTQLTNAGTDATPRISPDGHQIAFLQGEELWAITTDGSNLRQLVSSSYLASLVLPSYGREVIHWFTWDPLSSNLYFGTSTAGEAYTLPDYDLLVVTADGGTAPFIAFAAGLGGIATFSPNGLMIAMAQPTKILLTNTDGSNYHEAITFDLIQTYSEWFFVPEVVWFSDSSEFRTVIPAHDALGDPSEGTYFWSVPVAGSPIDMAGFTAVPAFQSAPRISPDGLNVAYMSPNGTNSELHLNGFYFGDELYSYYPVNQWGLVDWAPDSNGFVYWADDVRNLWFGHVGSAAVPLTDTLHVGNLHWIDIMRILFTNDGELRLGTPGGSSTMIDTGVTSGFDFNNN
jgi:hypothetical protein